jgi:FG-GAP-like repeat
MFCTLDNYQNNENYLEIHHGNPDGTFTKTPVFSKGYSNADFIQPFAARDLNGDSYLDILALSADGLVIFFGRPGMNFSAPVHYAFYNVGGFDEDQGDPSLIADYDLDGNMDLAMPGVNGIYITYGRADGTLDAPPVIRSGLTTGDSVVADFNEDGTPDIFTSGTTGLQLSLGKGNGSFAAPVTVQPSPLTAKFYLGSFAQLYEGDFNGDKHKDVIAFQSTQSQTFPTQLFLGRGDGTFQDPLPITNLVPGYSYAIADINGDGRDDLVYTTMDPASATGALNVLLSNGDGTLDPITTALPGNGYSYGLPAAADFNGDGKVDLIVPEQQTVQVLSGRGDGSFDAGTHTPPLPLLSNQSYACCSVVTTGDFDHDGNADFAVLAYSTGSDEGPTALIVYYGKGDGTFSQAATAAVLDRDYVHLIAADLNGDGLSDFVLSTMEGNGGNNDYRGTAISIVHSLPGRKFSGETNLVAVRASHPWLQRISTETVSRIYSLPTAI